MAWWYSMYVCLLTLNKVPAYELFRSHQYILATDNNVDYKVMCYVVVYIQIMS